VVLCLALLSLAATSASAINTSGSTVILPIIGRFPGVPPTQWRTDVFISNHFSPVANVTATLYVTGGSPIVRTITVNPFSVVTLPDITLTTFGLSGGAGQLELKAATSIEARARIYNAGGTAGEFGQNVPGLGINTLSLQGHLYGLSGINGNRLNIGVANPNAAQITVQLQVLSKNNNALFTRSVTLQPHETQQFNDIFVAFGITPQDGVQIEFTTGFDIFYAYASEVRNDTGDAVFMFGTSPNS
jgi:hypothetical protein